MPYIKQKSVPFNNFGAFVKGRLSTPELAEVLGCSQPTARKKVNKPELFTLGDIKKINERKHIPMDDLKEAIKK